MNYRILSDEQAGSSIECGDRSRHNPGMNVNRRAFTISTGSPILLFLIFALWALILTYPLPLHLATHIPLGAEAVGTIPLFNLWTLQWNIDQLMRGYPDYWDAPIFAPFSGVFAFSETQPLSALLAVPFWLIWPSRAVGYNAIVLLFLTLNGWFAYWLLKQWGGSHPAAVLTGLLIQTLPFVAQEMGVLQLIAIFGSLWSLLFLSRFLAQSHRDTVHWPTMIGLALGTPVTFFTCGYYGLFSLIFLPIALAFQIQRKDLNLKLFRQGLIVGLLIIILSIPFLWTQQQHLTRYNFVRSDQTITNNSAQLSSYIYALDYNLLYGRLLNWRPNQDQQRLFPGFGLIILASLGLFGRCQRRIKLYLLLAALLSLLLSLGLRLHLGDLLPYQWVRAYMPGFAQLRSPFRFAALTQLNLALLAGFGLHNLSRLAGGGGIEATRTPEAGHNPNLPAYRESMSRHRVSLSNIGAFAAACLVLVESLAIPLPLQPVPPLQQNVSWQRWLNQQDQPPSIIMLPFAASNRVGDFEQTVYWMLESRYYQGRLLNGYSGFFPPDHAQLRTLMLEFPTQAGLDLLTDLQTDYIVVHHNQAGAPAAESIANILLSVYEDTANQVSIYALSR